MSNAPQEKPALDEHDGDDIEQYIGEPVDPQDDPNLQEHYDG